MPHFFVSRVSHVSCVKQMKQMKQDETALWSWNILPNCLIIVSRVTSVTLVTSM